MPLVFSGGGILFMLITTINKKVFYSINAIFQNGPENGRKNGIKFTKNNKRIPGAHLQSLFFFLKTKREKAIEIFLRPFL